MTGAGIGMHDWHEGKGRHGIGDELTHALRTVGTVRLQTSRLGAKRYCACLVNATRNVNDTLNASDTYHISSLRNTTLALPPTKVAVPTSLSGRILSVLVSALYEAE